MEQTKGMNFDERRQRIAEAAYFRAEKRGFSGGDPVADWIDAEHEVDEALRRGNGDQSVGQPVASAPKLSRSSRRRPRQQ